MHSKITRHFLVLSLGLVLAVPVSGTSGVCKRDFGDESRLILRHEDGRGDDHGRSGTSSVEMNDEAQHRPQQVASDDNSMNKRGIDKIKTIMELIVKDQRERKLAELLPGLDLNKTPSPSGEGVLPEREPSSVPSPSAGSPSSVLKQVVEQVKSAADPPKRGRGRPKGVKNKEVYKKPPGRPLNCKNKPGYKRPGFPKGTPRGKDWATPGPKPKINLNHRPRGKQRGDGSGAAARGIDNDFDPEVFDDLAPFDSSIHQIIEKGKAVASSSDVSNVNPPPRSSPERVDRLQDLSSSQPEEAPQSATEGRPKYRGAKPGPKKGSIKGKRPASWARSGPPVGSKYNLVAKKRPGYKRPRPANAAKPGPKPGSQRTEAQNQGRPKGSKDRQPRKKPRPSQRLKAQNVGGRPKGSKARQPRKRPRLSQDGGSGPSGAADSVVPRGVDDFDGVFEGLQAFDSTVHKIVDEISPPAPATQAKQPQRVERFQDLFSSSHEEHQEQGPQSAASPERQGPQSAASPERQGPQSASPERPKQKGKPGPPKGTKRGPRLGHWGKTGPKPGTKHKLGSKKTGRKVGSHLPADYKRPANALRPGPRLGSRKPDGYKGGRPKGSTDKRPRQKRPRTGEAASDSGPNPAVRGMDDLDDVFNGLTAFHGAVEKMVKDVDERPVVSSDVSPPPRNPPQRVEKFQDLFSSPHEKEGPQSVAPESPRYEARPSSSAAHAVPSPQRSPRRLEQVVPHGGRPSTPPEGRRYWGNTRGRKVGSNLPQSRKKPPGWQRPTFWEKAGAKKGGHHREGSKKTGPKPDSKRKADALKPGPKEFGPKFAGRPKGSKDTRLRKNAAKAKPKPASEPSVADQQPGEKKNKGGRPKGAKDSRPRRKKPRTQAAQASDSGPHPETRGIDELDDVFGGLTPFDGAIHKMVEKADELPTPASGSQSKPPPQRVERLQDLFASQQEPSQHEEGHHSETSPSASPEQTQKKSRTKLSTLPEGRRFWGASRGPKKGSKKPPGWQYQPEWKTPGPKVGSKRPADYVRPANAKKTRPKKGYVRSKEWKKAGRPLGSKGGGRPKGRKDSEPRKRRKKTDVAGSSNQGSGPSLPSSGPSNPSNQGGRRGVDDLEDVWSGLGHFDETVHKIVEKVDELSNPASASQSEPSQRVERLQDSVSSQHEQGSSVSPEHIRKKPGPKKGVPRGPRPEGWAKAGAKVGTKHPETAKQTGPKVGSKRPPDYKRPADAKKTGPKKGYVRPKEWKKGGRPLGGKGGGRPKGKKDSTPRKRRKKSQGSGPSNQAGSPSQGSGPSGQSSQPSAQRRGLSDLDEVFSGLGAFDPTVHKIVENIHEATSSHSPPEVRPNSEVSSRVEDSASQHGNRPSGFPEGRNGRGSKKKPPGWQRPAEWKKAGAKKGGKHREGSLKTGPKPNSVRRPDALKPGPKKGFGPKTGGRPKGAKDAKPRVYTVKPGPKKGFRQGIPKPRPVTARPVAEPVERPVSQQPINKGGRPKGRKDSKPRNRKRPRIEASGSGSSNEGPAPFNPVRRGDDDLDGVFNSLGHFDKSISKIVDNVKEAASSSVPSPSVLHPSSPALRPESEAPPQEVEPPAAQQSRPESKPSGSGKRKRGPKKGTKRKHGSLPPGPKPGSGGRPKGSKDKQTRKRPPPFKGRKGLRPPPSQSRRGDLDDFHNSLEAFDPTVSKIVDGVSGAATSSSSSPHALLPEESPQRVEHSASQHEPGPPPVSLSPERPHRYPGNKRGRKKGVKQFPEGVKRPADWKPTGPPKGTTRPPRSALSAQTGLKLGFKRHPDRRGGRPKGSKGGRRKGAKDKQPRKPRSKASGSSEPSSLGSEPSNQGRRGVGDLDDIFSDLGSFDSSIEKVVGEVSEPSPSVASASSKFKPPQRVERLQDLFSQWKEAHPEPPESRTSPLRVEGSASHQLEAGLQPATEGPSKTRKRKRLPKGHKPTETETHTILGKFKPGWKPMKADQPANWKKPGPLKGVKKPPGWQRPEHWKPTGPKKGSKHGAHALKTGPKPGYERPKEWAKGGRKPGSKDTKPRKNRAKSKGGPPVQERGDDLDDWFDHLGSFDLAAQKIVEKVSKSPSPPPPVASSSKQPQRVERLQDLFSSLPQPASPTKSPPSRSPQRASSQHEQGLQLAPASTSPPATHGSETTKASGKVKAGYHPGWRPTGAAIPKHWKKTGPKPGTTKKPPGWKRPDAWKPCGRPKGSKKWTLKPKAPKESKPGAERPEGWARGGKKFGAKDKKPRVIAKYGRSGPVPSPESSHQSRGLEDFGNIFEGLSSIDDTVEKLVGKVGESAPLPAASSTPRQPQRVERLQDLFSTPPKAWTPSPPPLHQSPAAHAPAPPVKEQLPGKRKSGFYPGWRPSGEAQPAHWKKAGVKKGSKRLDTWKKTGPKIGSHRQPGPKPVPKQTQAGAERPAEWRKGGRPKGSKNKPGWKSRWHPDRHRSPSQKRGFEDVDKIFDGLSAFDSTAETIVDKLSKSSSPPAAASSLKQPLQKVPRLDDLFSSASKDGSGSSSKSPPRASEPQKTKSGPSGSIQPAKTGRKKDSRRQSGKVKTGPKQAGPKRRPGRPYGSHDSKPRKSKYNPTGADMFSHRRGFEDVDKIFSGLESFDDKVDKIIDKVGTVKSKSPPPAAVAASSSKPPPPQRVERMQDLFSSPVAHQPSPNELQTHHPDPSASSTHQPSSSKSPTHPSPPHSSMDPATGRRKLGWKPSGPERSPFWKKTGPKKGYKRPAEMGKPGPKPGFHRKESWKKPGRKKGSTDTKPRKKRKSIYAYLPPPDTEHQQAESIPQRGLGDLDDVFVSLEPFDKIAHKIVEKVSDKKRPAATDTSTSRPPPQKVQRIQDLFSSSSHSKEPHRPAQVEQGHQPAQHNEVINSSSPPGEVRPTSSAKKKRPARPPGLVASKSPAPEGRKHLFYPGWRPKKADQPAHWKLPGPKKGTKRPAGWVRPETWKKNGPSEGTPQPENKRPGLRLGRQPGAKDKKPRVGGGRQHGAKDKKPRKNSKLLKQQSVSNPTEGSSATGSTEPGPPRRKLGRPPGAKDSKPRKYAGRQPGALDSRPRKEYALQGTKPTSWKGSAPPSSATDGAGGSGAKSPS